MWFVSIGIKLHFAMHAEFELWELPGGRGIGKRCRRRRGSTFRSGNGLAFENFSCSGAIAIGSRYTCQGGKKKKKKKLLPHRTTFVLYTEPRFFMS